MEQLFNKTQYENNEIVAKVFVGLSVFALVIWGCCLLQVFNFNIRAATFFAGISITALIIPVIIIYVFHINKPFMKYVLIGIVTLIVGVYYCIFTFQMLIMFVIPSLIAMLYMNKKLLYFSGILMIITIFGAHIVTNYFVLQPWLEPFMGMKSIIQYGVIPRIMQYGVCFGILVMLMNRMLSYMEQLKVICSERIFDTQLNEKEYDKEWKQYNLYIGMLTEREKEVFLQVLMGKTNAQIAETLHLALGTVKNYISSIYEKIGIKERNYLILKFSHFAVTYDQSNNSL